MFGGLGSSGNAVWQKIIDQIIDPIILFIFTLGFLLFVYGIYVYIQNLTVSGERDKGKQHMIWGIVGMFIMVAAWGIIQMITDTFDLDINSPTSGSDFPAPSSSANFGFPEEFR